MPRPPADAPKPQGAAGRGRPYPGSQPAPQQEDGAEEEEVRFPLAAHRVRGLVANKTSCKGVSEAVSES